MFLPCQKVPKSINPNEMPVCVYSGYLTLSAIFISSDQLQTPSLHDAFTYKNINNKILY